MCRDCLCVFAANVGVPVSEMDDSYVKESATLSEAIIKYGTLDLYDPQRVQVINVSSSQQLMYSSHTHLAAIGTLSTCALFLCSVQVRCKKVL